MGFCEFFIKRIVVKLNSKLFLFLSIVSTILVLMYFIFFLTVDAPNIPIQEMKKTSINKSSLHDVSTKISTKNYLKENLNLPRQQNKNYKDIFKEDTPNKDLIRNMEEEKNIKAIELKAQQFIKETQAFLIKNNLSMPPSQMTPEQQKQFEIKTQELEKKLEKLQNSIQEI